MGSARGRVLGTNQRGGAGGGALARGAGLAGQRGGPGGEGGEGRGREGEGGGAEGGDFAAAAGAMAGTCTWRLGELWTRGWTRLVP